MVCTRISPIRNSGVVDRSICDSFDHDEAICIDELCGSGHPGRVLVHLKVVPKQLFHFRQILDLFEPDVDFDQVGQRQATLSQGTSQMLKDIPSGQFTEPVEIIISGDIHALAFFSTGTFGEMREIWFLRNGYLYEVTTYASLDGWLAEILATWNFED